MTPDPDVTAAHRHSIYNRGEVLRSRACGCFYCRSVFAPTDVREWTDRNTRGPDQTALCPRCGVDSVIGDASGFTVTAAFLAAMHARWFEQ